MPNFRNLNGKYGRILGVAKTNGLEERKPKIRKMITYTVAWNNSA